MAVRELPKGWSTGLPKDLGLREAQELCVVDVDASGFVYKRTDTVAGLSRDHVVGVPGDIESFENILLGPEVEEAVKRYS